MSAITKAPIFVELEYKRPSLEQPVGIRRSPSSRAGEDGRRFGVIRGIDQVVESRNSLPAIVDWDDPVELGLERKKAMRGRAPRKNTIDTWKTGLVPELRTP